MRTFPIYCICISMMVLSGISNAQSVRDRSASIQDITAQQARNKTLPVVQLAIRQYTCLKMQYVPPPPPGPMTIPHHYLVGSSGATNPLERAAGKFYGAFESRVAAGANQWLARGKEAEASCALDQLDVWAQARALLEYDVKSYPQSWYQVEWTLSAIAIADSILVNDAALDQAKQQRVNTWLNEVANTMMHYDRPHGNNHHYWRGLAAIAVGVSTGDDQLFTQGVTAYRDGIEEIDSQGAFPQEMARHENAIHYQDFAIEPLIILAEFAERQGVDLYSYSSHGRTLRDALLFLSRAVDDPSVVIPYTRDSQKTTFVTSSFSAEAFYVHRFGTKGLSSLITRKTAQTEWQPRLGGSPIVFLASTCSPATDVADCMKTSSKKR